MQVDANKAIEKLSIQIAQQAQQIAILQVQLETCLGEARIRQCAWRYS